MEQKLTDAFRSVHMDQECSEKIEKAMKRKTETPAPVRPQWRRVAAAAACLMLAAATIAIPTIAESINLFQQAITEQIERGEIINVTEIKELDNGFIVYKYDNGHSGTFSAATTVDWLKESDGRLYFTANGEYIDITDKISYDDPFTYIYTDEAQIVHYLAAGGVYDPDPLKCDYGWLEYFQNASGTEAFSPEAGDGWIGGHGHNHVDCDTYTEYPWSVKAMIEFDSPWTAFAIERAE